MDTSFGMSNEASMNEPTLVKTISEIVYILIIMYIFATFALFMYNAILLHVELSNKLIKPAAKVGMVSEKRVSSSCK